MRPADGAEGAIVADLSAPRLTLTPLERHSGLVTGLGPYRHQMFVPDAAASPRSTLESIVLHHLSRGPCAVQFSGGRDSSLVLAVAAFVARKHGLDPPAAVTIRYPDSPLTHESDWQDQVVASLGVPHEIVEVRGAGNDIAGPLGMAQLARFGPRFPPPAGVSLGCLARTVAGRTLLTGEGGDEVLGPTRATLYVAHWRRRRRPTKDAFTQMVENALPRPGRRALAVRQVDQLDPAPWLRGDARTAAYAGLVEDLIDNPWDWRTARWRFVDSRLFAVGSHSMRDIARGEGFAVETPLLAPEFVASVCRAGGPLGWTTRTEAMSILARDLLPDALIHRRSKATFNEVYAADHVREFARRWDGSGVDREIVDVEILRAAWLADVVSGTSMVPLQLALHASLSRRSDISDDPESIP